jgi:hypothetical protein
MLRCDSDVATWAFSMASSLHISRVPFNSRIPGKETDFADALGRSDDTSWEESATSDIVPMQPQLGSYIQALLLNRTRIVLSQADTP